jgi:hypothetical protein
MLADEVVAQLLVISAAPAPAFRLPAGGLIISTDVFFNTRSERDYPPQ